MWHLIKIEKNDTDIQNSKTEFYAAWPMGQCQSAVG